jgi:hypothetical protein
MATKKTLLYRRNGRENPAALIDFLLGRSRKMLVSPGLTGSAMDLIRLIRLSRELQPAAPMKTTVRWID